MVGIAEIIVAKHRNGATGDVRLRFREEMAKFTDLDITEYPAYSNVEPIAPKAVTFKSKMNQDPFPDSSGFNDNDLLSGTTIDGDLPY
jgi:replicative DNA helicase